MADEPKSGIDFADLYGKVGKKIADAAEWYSKTPVGRAVTEGPPIEEGAANPEYLSTVAHEGEMKAATSGVPLTPGPDPNSPINKPFATFRQGAENISEDLERAGDNPTLPLTGAARGMLKGTAKLMQMVPVGPSAAETALMAPISFEDLGAQEVKPTIEHFAATETEPAKAVLTDATGKKIGQAKWTQEGPEAHLNGIYVDTKGRGHGKMLLDSVVDKAQQAGAKGLTVGKVNSASPDAIALFDRVKEKPVTTIESPIKGSQARRIILEKNVPKAAPQKIIEDQGLKYKGEVSPGSGVHMFEHPDHPGRTAALAESKITPEGVKAKMDSKIAEFQAAAKL
jgi:ribosomal protein S18 acetylase RimI-like enzyme